MGDIVGSGVMVGEPGLDGVGRILDSAGCDGILGVMTVGD